MITQDLGIATAYGYAKSKGYTGTEAEFAELMASYASTAQTAIEAADRAVEANTAAQSAKTDAAASKTAAQTAAQTATTKASEASQSASTATTKASEASTSASTASSAATSAGTSAQTATTAATTATTKASEAAESEAAALSAKTDAETARDAAAQSASQAAASAESIDPDEFNRKIYAAFATDIATGSVASFPDGADSIPMKDVLVHIEPVQAGSGDPSPENVRPITGWTGAKVTRCGKNIFPFNDSYSASGYTYLLDHVPFSLYPGTYTFSAVPNMEADSVVLFGHHEDGTRTEIGRLTASTTRSSATNTVSKPIVSLSLVTNRSGTISNLQLELGSTATDYEPYSGQTYDITFPSEAGTVYGGTLDVTTGELVVDRAIMTLDGTQSLSPNGKTSVSSRFGLNVAGKAVGERNILSNMFYTTPIFVDDVGWVYGRAASNYVEFSLPPDIEQTTAAGKAWFAENPTQLCYELATPITYQLTPQEITSLLGTNNVWADTGNTEVEYRASTKMYIDKKITEAVSALS